MRLRGATDPIVAYEAIRPRWRNLWHCDLVARFAREHLAENCRRTGNCRPSSADTFTAILRYSCAQFDRNGRFHPDNTKPDDRKVPLAGPHLVVTDTWALYARPRSENFFTADLERLKEAVEAAEALPGPAVALVSQPSDEPTYTLSASLGDAQLAAAIAVWRERRVSSMTHERPGRRVRNHG